MKHVLLLLATGLIVLGCNQPLGNNGNNGGGETASPPEPPAELQHLDTIDDGVSSGFGQGLAMSPSFAAISDTGDTSPTNGRGVVHIYDRSTSPWSHKGTVEPVSEQGWPSHTFYYFGTAVSMTDEYLVVGTPYYKEGNTTGLGNVQVFEYNSSTDNWDYMTSLWAETPEGGEKFGWMLDMDGSSIIASAPVADHYNSNTDTTSTTRGEAYIFDLNSADVWEPTQLQPATENDNDNFGWEVAISGNRALVGMPGDDTYGTNSGSVASFEYSNGSWSRTDQFVPPTDSRSPKDNFGRSVDLDGDTAVIGASHLDKSTGGWTGKGYIYLHDGNSWALDTYILGRDDLDTTDEIQLDLHQHSRLGDNVAISGNRVLIAAPYENNNVDFTDYWNTGAVFVFDDQNGSYGLTAKLYAPVPPEDDLFFGDALAIEGNTFLASENAQAFVFR
ncbi:MAG: FG-GAP repeat protein [Spirochaetia bacterium]|nr:FG-GAP repeat protein [Spirochaetia bacterium]